MEPLQASGLFLRNTRGAVGMSNEFKVIDTQTGEDVTHLGSWTINTCGELQMFGKPHGDQDRYQVRRSTGISDKNGRVLFDKERVIATEGSKKGKRSIVHWRESDAMFEFPWDLDDIECCDSSYCATRVISLNGIEYIEAES